jgi:hypothetical protein
MRRMQVDWDEKDEKYTIQGEWDEKDENDTGGL